MTINELKAKIEDTGKIYGTFEHVTIIEDAFHACIPNDEYTWCAHAVYFDEEDKELRLTKVYWDFSCVENYSEIEDSSCFPWDMEEIMTIDNDLDSEDTEDILERGSRFIR